MDEIKHSRRFAEIETLMGSYFRHHLVPVMTQTLCKRPMDSIHRRAIYSRSLYVHITRGDREFRVMEFAGAIQGDALAGAMGSW